ncbi:NAD-dependent epimerase/dehydratase family protein [Paenibacillus hunanensis]|uniref:Nucleoside-diphosphate-sugar epimerase n=1 Tax=Paenibacillus hunanensis TaxID=539262 RepID=A0ABU1ITH7_9BACL|nr:NAD(P)-dependent oxidoreductase [Paenibacillus hunanensis]MDR6242206.1 nucleoside-diphosphate-sugar epimerase [Paenibacillus hunanensis]GGJ06107.1 dTDP-glucose 4,6-dehydratase [Paenibacillus hunanensis]
MKIFVAGASGVIGKLLLPQLVEAGHEVIGMTRKEEQKSSIEQAGARAVLADVFDREQMMNVLSHVQPDVVIHQLTSLSGGSSAENARIRIEGTRNLVDAAKQANVQKMIAQSISWLYEPGKTPATEDTAIDLHAAMPRSTTINGVLALEQAVQEIPKHVILRYGTLYGPATWYAEHGDIAEKVRHKEMAATDGVSSFLHVEDAIRSALLALDWQTGTYNIVDDEPAKGTAWLPIYAQALGAPAPDMQSGANGWERGASNHKVKQECGWSPQYATWRTGFFDCMG